jgi:hypothetical protein
LGEERKTYALIELFRFWHFSDMARRPDDVRSWGQTGHAAKAGPLPFLDPERTWALMGPMIELRGPRDPAVDFTAQRHKVDRLCQ